MADTKLQEQHSAALAAGKLPQPTPLDDEATLAKIVEISPEFMGTDLATITAQHPDFVRDVREGRGDEWKVSRDDEPEQEGEEAASFDDPEQGSQNDVASLLAPNATLDERRLANQAGAIAHKVTSRRIEALKKDFEARIANLARDNRKLQQRLEGSSRPEKPRKFAIKDTPKGGPQGEAELVNEPPPKPAAEPEPLKLDSATFPVVLASIVGVVFSLLIFMAITAQTAFLPTFQAGNATAVRTASQVFFWLLVLGQGHRLTQWWLNKVRPPEHADWRIKLFDVVTTLAPPAAFALGIFVVYMKVPTFSSWFTWYVATIAVIVIMSIIEDLKGLRHLWRRGYLKFGK